MSPPISITPYLTESIFEGVHIILQQVNFIVISVQVTFKLVSQNWNLSLKAADSILVVSQNWKSLHSRFAALIWACKCRFSHFTFCVVSSLQKSC
jgi:hypothetical protein